MPTEKAVKTDKVVFYAGWEAIVNGEYYSNQIMLEGPEEDAKAIEALRDNLEESLRKIKNGVF